jgi:hypothetical protein
VRRPNGSRRRLLIASVGVAAVSYACEKKPPPEPIGNLVAPEPTASETPNPTPPEPVGNLVAPEPDPIPPDAGN